MSAIKAGAAFVELGVRNRMERGLNAASKRLKGFAAGVSGAGMSVAGMGMKIAAPFTLAAGVFGVFDQKMAAVKAITGATEADMARLRDTAKSLGASTQFSASQAAEAMTFLGMAGFKTEEILAGLPAVLNLAAAGALDLGTAADIASDVSSAFGLAADEIGRVSDVLAATATSSNTSVEMMGETFKYLAPLAAAAGQSIEQAAAAVGIVANSGVKASIAGTDLALMMKTLANPAAQKALEKMGVATVDAGGNVRDFSDIISDLSAATAGMTEAERLGFFEQMFGRAAKSAIILANASGDLEQLGNNLENAGGSAARMAATMSDSLMGDFTKTLSALEGVAIAVGEAIEKPVRSFLSQVSEILSKSIEWISANKGVVTSVAAIGAGLLVVGGALLAIAAPVAIAGALLGGLATFAGVFASTVGVLGTVIGALVSPIGLGIAAVTAITAAVLYFSGAGSTAVQFLKDTFSSLSAEVSHVAAGILAALNTGDLETIGKILSQSLILYWNMAIGSMKKAWISFSTSVVNILDSTFAGIMDGSLINSLATKMGMAVAGILDKAVEVFRNAFLGILKFLGMATDKFQSTVVSISDTISAANEGSPESRAAARNAAAAARIAEIDAEIDALRNARDETIADARVKDLQARVEMAEQEADELAKKEAETKAKAAASGAGEMLRGSAITPGTFSAFAAERTFRSGGGVADEFKKVGQDIVTAVQGTTDAVNGLEGATFAP